MIGGNFGKPGMGGGVPAPLPQGGVQNQQLQQRAQGNVPFQGRYNGNPRGAANMPRNNNPFGFQGQGQAPAWSQQTNLGRYRPPTMTQFGGNAGGFNSNQWNDFGGMDYNLPGSYGSPLGQGQFAPMPGQFMQQYMQLMGMGAQPYDPGYDSIGMGNDMNYASTRMSGGMPPGKDGRPLPDPNQAGSVGTDPLSFLRNQTMINNGMAPSFNQRRRGFNRNAEMAPQPMEPMPAYDRPENRNYNMAALYQMMGGY